MEPKSQQVDATFEVRKMFSNLYEVTNLCRAITTPDVTMSHETQQGVRSPPFRIMFQTGCGKYRKSFNDSTKSLAQDQALDICHNSLPFVVIGIR